MYEWQAFNIKFPCKRPKKDHKQIKPKKTPNLSKSYRHNKSSTVIKGLSTSSAAIKGHINTQESHLYFSLKKMNSLDNTEFLLRLFSGLFLHFTQTLSPCVYIYINTALWVNQKNTATGNFKSYSFPHAIKTTLQSIWILFIIYNRSEKFGRSKSYYWLVWRVMVGGAPSGKDKALLQPQTFWSHREITWQRSSLHCDTVTFI